MKKCDATIHLNPDVFKWVVAGSGWDAKELSEKTGIRLDSIQRWETSNAPIRINELKKISKTIKRPISVLLLPEPPSEKRLPDYRKIGGMDSVKLSKKTFDVIRHARYVQSIAIELLEIRSEDTQPILSYKNLQDSSETVAELEQKSLDISFEKQSKESMADFSHKTYQNLKKKIEKLNIFVLQLPINISEARGFSFSDGCPKIILVNSKENSKSRIFTLLHEYAHLLLNIDGICPVDSDDINQSQHKDVAVERWCNHFARAVIMPKNTMLSELNNIMANHTPKQIVTFLMRKFCASRKDITVRILNLLFGEKLLYKKYAEYYETLPATNFTATTRASRRNMAQECINRNGMKYVKLVADSKDQNLITVNDMVRYLNLKTKYFEKLKGMI